MKLYLSFEQSAVVAPEVDHKGHDLDTGYVVVADAPLYDGPGAKQPPGNILWKIGPIPQDFYQTALKEVVKMLRTLPITFASKNHLHVMVCGEDF